MFKLCPLGILTRGFVGEGLVQLDAFELANFILIDRADTQVADEPFPALFFATVRLGSLALAMHCQNTRKSILVGRFLSDRKCRESLYPRDTLQTKSLDPASGQL